MSIFYQLEHWFSKERENLEAQGFSVDFVKCKPTENTAAYFDVDIASLMARVTIWESLEINFDVFEIDGGKQIVADYYQCVEYIDIVKLLDECFARLKELHNKSTTTF